MYQNASKENKKAFDEALKKASEVAKKPNATKEEIETAKKALEKAKNDLTKSSGNTNGGSSTPGTSGGSSGGSSSSPSGGGSSTNVGKENKVEAKAKFTFSLKSNIIKKQVSANEVQEIKMDANPYIENNRVMLPIRFISEIVGVKVQWDRNTRTATFTKDGKIAAIKANTEYILYTNNGVSTKIKMDAKAVIKNNRMFVSLRNVKDIFDDTKIIWDAKEKSVTIEK